MSQWKLFANASANTSGPVQWVAEGYQQGSGATAQQANNLSLVSNSTAGALRDAPQFGGNGTNQVAQNRVVGQFAFTAGAYANALANATSNATYTGEGRKIPGGTGWVVRKAGMGPITGLVAANGQTFANGETALISGGVGNTLVTVTANATGNLATATVLGSGTFPNGQSFSSPGLFANIAGTITFSSELHVANVQIGANSAAFTNLPAANSPITVTVSNTGANSTVGVGGGLGLNAVGTFVSNIAAGITNTILNTITWSGANTPPFANGTGYFGLFGPVQPNTAVVIVFTNANGQVIANGTPASLATPLVTHGGTPNVHVSALGGRGGRVSYETLVATRFIANGALAGGAYVNVATLTVTGNTGTLGSVNALSNGSTLQVSNGTAVVNAVAAIVTDANGSLQNTGITLVLSNGFVGGEFPTGTANTNLVVSVISKTGAVLNFANVGSVMPTGKTGANLTFGGTVATVAANASTFLPQ